MNEAKNRLKSAPYHPSDLIRGEDGELYHLPTLRALHSAGRLVFGSAGYLVLMGRTLQTARLIA